MMMCIDGDVYPEGRYVIICKSYVISENPMDLLRRTKCTGKRKVLVL